jgi:hypothetical protein
MPDAHAPEGETSRRQEGDASNNRPASSRRSKRWRRIAARLRRGRLSSRERRRRHRGDGGRPEPPRRRAGRARGHYGALQRRGTRMGECRRRIDLQPRRARCSVVHHEPVAQRQTHRRIAMQRRGSVDRRRRRNARRRQRVRGCGAHASTVDRDRAPAFLAAKAHHLAPNEMRGDVELCAAGRAGNLERLRHAFLLPMLRGGPSHLAPRRLTFQANVPTSSSTWVKSFPLESRVVTAPMSR